MIKALQVIILSGLLLMGSVGDSFWVVVDYWLTDDPMADFNRDGIVNMADYAMIESYGSDEYGLDSYGH